MEYATTSGETGLLAIETKFVEKEFSRCAFRKKRQCPGTVCLGSNFTGCGYTQKGYRYWQQTATLGTLGKGAMPLQGCPFGDALWQLWVNHTLVHAEARQRNARHALFAVCAPAANVALLQDGKVLARFKELVAHPATVLFIPVERLIAELRACAPDGKPWQQWIAGLEKRYVVTT